jgi:hypothetical protein
VPAPAVTPARSAAIRIKSWMCSSVIRCADAGAAETATTSATQVTIDSSVLRVISIL